MSSTALIPTTTTGGLFPTLFPTPSSTSSQAGGIAPRSSSLYLFTFLITLVVLAGIIGALVFRSIVIRRRFQNRVAEAIARGERPPVRQGGIMGGPRTKPKIKLGPEPIMWEAKMLLQEKMAPGDTLQQPMSISFPEQPLDSVSPPADSAALPQSRGRRFANLFQSDTDPSLPVGPSRRPIMPPRTDSVVAPAPSRLLDIPPIGTPLTLGVLIAMPHQDEAWHPREEDEEMDLPHVVLGIATVKLQ